MTIVDTTVWIDFLGSGKNAESDWLAMEIQRTRVGLTDLILCEVAQGVRGDAAFWRLIEHLSEFEIFSTGGAALAVASASNYRALRAKGHTVRKTIACLIATFCIENGHVLLHRDRDFDPFEQYLGLRVIHL